MLRNRSWKLKVAASATSKEADRQQCGTAVAILTGRFNNDNLVQGDRLVSQFKTENVLKPLKVDCLAAPLSKSARPDRCDGFGDNTPRRLSEPRAG